MNYSLVGKARVAAKNQIRAKKAHSANIAMFAEREASRSQKVLVLSENGLKWVKGRVKHSLMVV